VLLKSAVNDKLTVSCSDSIAILEVPAGAPRLDDQNAATAVPALRNRSADFRLLGKDARKFRCLVRMAGPEGWIEFATVSKYGGKDKKRITIKNQ
jgi:hypothetical protein